MTSENGTTLPEGAAPAGAEAQELKGKGKAATAEQPVDTAMEEDDDDDDDEEEGEGEDDEVCFQRPLRDACVLVQNTKLTTWTQGGEGGK